MQVDKIIVDQAKARELYRAYKTHQHYSTPIDAEIQRVYQLIAQGKTIIQAVKSIETAGLGPDRMPLLALTRADANVCYWQTANGGGTFAADSRWQRAQSKRIVARIAGVTHQHPEGMAVVPLIPAPIRPKRGIENYHILWEADWKAIPKDPYLLRRIGKGDMWLVVAAWDLTEVERAAMAARVTPQ